jgi:hypothetical protein
MKALPLARKPITGMTPSTMMRARTDSFEKASTMTIGRKDMGRKNLGPDAGPRRGLAAFRFSKTENG